MGWLANFFKSPNGIDEPSHSTGFYDLDGSPVPLKSVAADLRIARELINSAAMQTSLAYGVPPRWLNFEVVTISDDEKAYFQLQVVMNHWDEYLAAHCYAFERAVIKRIREENIEVGRAIRAVLWRVAPDAGCPYDQMPEAQAWSADEVKKRGQVRDRINRELYALSTPASGAVVYAAVAGAVPATMPVSADEAERADRSTQPEKYHSSQEDSAFSETRPSSFNGFPATHPDSPLMSGIIDPTKK
jgi:hypothetical protein